RRSSDLINANPVDGVGGQHDALASLDGLARDFSRLRVERRISSRAVESPMPHGEFGFSRPLRVRFAGHAGRGHRSILPELRTGNRWHDKITWQAGSRAAV